MDLNERVPGDLDPVLVGLPADVLGEHLPHILQIGHVQEFQLMLALAYSRGESKGGRGSQKVKKKEWKRG